ncbi:MAG: asparagine synthase (glutamine-hydrolyzing) [Clostridia bacterium]|nr:asparagine synthase (glutamine-hydrolyzing) [Clostridia bacterium]
MQGFVGFSTFQKSTFDFTEILTSMSKKLPKSNVKKTSLFECENISLAQVSDEEICTSYTINSTTYAIILNGVIYNIEELKKSIKTFSDIHNNTDEEILLKYFIENGPDIMEKINGIFSLAIWDDSKKELFIARDHFGIKPLYFSFTNNTLVFSTKLSSLFEHPFVTPHVEKEGLCEIFGLGPAHTPGVTPFKDVEELKPAHFLLFNKNGIYIKQYWSLVSRPHEENLKQTTEKIRYLLEDAINLQLKTNKKICTFLSGGLDSSIISLYASKYLNNNSLPNLNTFSVDYLDNDKNFVKSEFQPNSDNYYIDIMKKKLNSNHETIIIDTPELANSLKDSMLARDYPGMADVDSSLLLFCKNVRPYAAVSLTGECSDEIFGGYPWFFKEKMLDLKTFPWSLALSERQRIMNPLMAERIKLKDYVDYRYYESLSSIDTLLSDSPETAENRKISHLTLNWFMQTLLDRSERMATSCDFEIRVPFCDYRLVEYAWNIPWEMKALNGREKGLLRYSMKGLLPEQIIERKKSPYPKTHNPTYLKKVKKILSNILNNKNAPLNYLVNTDFVTEILNNNGTSFESPWFGQLMTGPQLMAYLIQLNMWLEEFKPIIE